VTVELIELDDFMLHCLLAPRTDDSLYVASHLPWLADFVPSGSLGLAVGAPDQRCLVAWPLTPPVAPGITAVFRATQERHHMQSAAVSPDVYWWRDGVIRRIARTPHEGEDEEVIRTPAYLRLVDQH
jgi:hypothetical protein